MQYLVEDFAGAREYFDGSGSREWAELDSVLESATPQLQASDQEGIAGSAIFDPKATNAELTQSAASLGWRAVPVPSALSMFGKDWDAGKSAVLVEWQFSNYPFLWNNIIRTQGIFASRATLPRLRPIEALVIVTKSGVFPASNSTLYYEQARAQIQAVMSLNTFTVPIRLIGLTVPAGATSIEADWNVYPNRYSREATETIRREFSVSWGNPRNHGHRLATLRPRT